MPFDDPAFQLAAVTQAFEFYLTPEQREFWEQLDEHQRQIREKLNRELEMYVFGGTNALR